MAKTKKKKATEKKSAGKDTKSSGKGKTLQKKQSGTKKTGSEQTVKSTKKSKVKTERVKRTSSTSTKKKSAAKSEKTSGSSVKKGVEEKAGKKGTEEQSRGVTEQGKGQGGKLKQSSGNNNTGHTVLARGPIIPSLDDDQVKEMDYPVFTEEDLRKVKTGLTRKDMEYFTALLIEKRLEIIGDVENMELMRAAGSGGDLSHMPLHMADIGSDNYEQEFTLGLVESERKLLREIDEALMRIKNGTYGVCIESGQPISKARLEVRPWAKYTIEVARERERRGLPI